VCISGRNMGSTSSITRVWDIGIVDRLGRLKLDLEAVVEDANEKVYSFQIQRSLIYLKFVGLYNISYYLRIIPKIDFLPEILLEEGLFRKVPLYSTVFEY